VSHQVLLVGLGGIGMGYDLELGEEFVYSHARAISGHPSFALAAAVDPDPSRRQTFERAYGRPAFAGLAEALRQHRPDVVIVATPTAAHGATVTAVLAAHTPKAVLCEKPVAPGLAEARALIELCRDRGVALYVNYIRRSVPGFIEVARRIAAAQIQAPVKGTMWYSKGLLHNGSHLVNVLQAWLGPVQRAEVLDRGRSLADGDAEPDARLIFRDGAVVVLAAREEQFTHSAIELVAANGRLRVEQGGFRIEWQPVAADPEFPGYAVLSPSVEALTTGMERYQAHVVTELAAALAGRPAALCSGNDALDTMESIQQILENR
jgi:predicted dehydrogenase